MTAQEEEEVPVIDLSLHDDEVIAKDLVTAFCTFGFATLVNHGVDMSTIQQAFAASQSFFALDFETKQKYRYQGHLSNRGYIEMGKETHERGSCFDRKETFDIGKEDESGFQNLWPEELPGFKDTLLAYFQEFDQLHLRLLKLLAIGLQLDDADFFVNACNEQHCNLRLLHYQELARDSRSQDPIERCADHTDYGTLTLLAQDKTGGLRVQRLDGTWTFLQPVEGGIVINVGDMLARWTNDVLRATPHQVVDHPSHHSIIPDRYSIAFFANANKGVLLEPLVASDEPAKYPPVRALDYLTKRLRDTIVDDSSETS